MIGIKKKDKVKVISGKEKGKTGEVLQVHPDTQRVVVSKLNFVKKHSKPTQVNPGGIHEKEAAMSISKVMLLCPKCNQTTRLKVDTLSDGKKIRVCRKCSEMIS
jgi:large subunit ribosomal protein L24